MGSDSDSESDVHKALRHRVQLLAGAIAQQWEGGCMGRAVILSTLELAVPRNVSERRTCIANERVIAAYRAFWEMSGRSQRKKAGSPDDSDSGDGAPFLPRMNAKQVQGFARLSSQHLVQQVVSMESALLAQRQQCQCQALVCLTVCRPNLLQ